MRPGEVRLEYARAADIPAATWAWPHIDPAREWACKGTGRVVVVPDFLSKVELLRRMYGRPLIITSGYRSPEHNRKVSESGDHGPHTTGHALDVKVFGTHAWELLGLALSLGFSGIGVGQKGPAASRILHFDDLLAEDGYPRPWVWSY